MRKTPWILKHPLESVLCVLLAAIVLITFTQVLFRYLLHLSLGWTEELARFVFLWLAALTSAYGFKTRSHFALRFLVKRLNPSARKAAETVVVSAMTLFFLLFIWKGVEYVISVAPQTAPSTRLSMAVPYSSAVTGGILMLYYIVKNWWRDMRRAAEQGGAEG